MSYNPKVLFKNPHINTLFPYLFRKVPLSYKKRERISTPDGDFLDVDWFGEKTNKLVILSHGLEGSSRQSYILGMAETFLADGFMVLAWNCRGCSGELNLKAHFYHSGMTTDLNTVVDYALNHHTFDFVALVGFSMGGNITLKYLGEKKIYPLVSNINAAVAISTPVDLADCAYELSKLKNTLYMQTFLLTLKRKLYQKKQRFSHLDIDLKKAFKAQTFFSFDEFVTAPMFGFKDAKEYWQKNSSLYFLHSIETPSLLISGKDDPFLGKNCFPMDEHKFIRYLYAPYGGHVGFVSQNLLKQYWSETETLNYVRSVYASVTRSD